MYYVPWKTMDVTGLIARLPNLYEGASRWIRAFEEETLGHLIAIGDITFLLGRALGSAGLSDEMHSQHLADILSTHADDADQFNNIRTEVWDSLRKLFPDKVQLDMLEGEPIGETEDPSTYVHRLLRLWRAELRKNPEADVFQKAMFRQGVIQKLPPAVRTRLGDVVGLRSMDFTQFCAHVTHAISKHREHEGRRLERDRSNMCKLTQKQLKAPHKL